MAGGSGRILSAWHYPVLHFLSRQSLRYYKGKEQLLSKWTKKEKENPQVLFGFFATIKWPPLVLGSRHEKKQDLISSLGCTLVRAPASAQQCIRAQQEQGERGWWKGINNTCLNSQRGGKGMYTVHHFKAFLAISVSAATLSLLFIPRLQPQAALQHTYREKW